MYPCRGEMRCDPGCGSSPLPRSLSRVCGSPSLGARECQRPARSGAGVLAGCGLKIALGELPPACFLQVRLFELHHDLTRITHTRPNESGLASQMGNCSDISFVTQHYPINELVRINASGRRIVQNPLSPVLEDPAPRVYAAAVFDCQAKSPSPRSALAAAIRVQQLGTREWLPLNDGYRAARGHAQGKPFPKHARRKPFAPPTEHFVSIWRLNCMLHFRG
jgi:hypothetical protein